MSLINGFRRKFRFGPFEADPDTGELRKNGRRVRLQEKSFQVLLALLEQRGMLVNREGLRDRLWAADTFVDFDNGLNTAVSKLREALGDSAETPRFIETLARRGYRFIAQVEEFGEPPAASPRLQLAIRRLEPDIVVAEIAGRIVLGPECQQIERLVSDLLRSNETRVIFDLSGVSHLDSTGVGIIVVCSGELKRAGGELRVVGAKGIVEQILRTTRVDTIVSLHATEGAAAEAFRRCQNAATR